MVGIPLVILDTTDRLDLEEFIRVHQYHGPGDVDSQWAFQIPQEGLRYY